MTSKKDVEKAFELWNEFAKAKHLSCARLLTDTRKRAIKQRLEDLDGLEDWKAMLEKVASSSFLLGDNNRGWKVSLDFVSKKQNYIKILEGVYDDDERSNSTQRKTNGLYATAAAINRKRRGEEASDNGIHRRLGSTAQDTRRTFQAHRASH